MEKNHVKLKLWPASLVWIRPVLIIVAFSLLLGWFGGTVTKPYKDREYQPLWGSATWVAPKIAAATGYYRTKFMIDSLPIKASIQIAAPDHFDVFVNGKMVGGNSFTSILTSGNFDITSLLEVGPNVIAIRVAKKTYSGPPLMIANGYWQDSIGGEQNKIVTGIGSWRVSIKQEAQLAGKLPWFEKNFIDDHWDKPLPYTLKGDEVIQQLTIPPELFTDFPRGQWIWSSDSFALSGTLRRSFDLKGRNIERAWLGIATNGTYKLAINDVIILTGSPGNTNMDTLNIGRYLKFGRNNIALDITSHQSGIRLAVAAKVTVDGVETDLSSDKNWLVRSDNAGASDSDDEWTSAYILGPMKPIPISHEIKVKSGVLRGMPAIRMIKMDIPLMNILNEVVRFFWWMIGVLLANYFLASFFISFIEKWAPTDKLSALEIYAIPNFVGTLLITVLIVVGYDLRIDTMAIYNRITFFGIFLVISGWIAWMMWEVYSKQPEYIKKTGPLEGRNS